MRAEEERPELFRGHLEECLRHLEAALAAEAPKGSKGAAEARKPIADFCGIGVATVTRWFYSSGSLPLGEPHIKLMCFLDLHGYRVIELERMPKVRRNFAELIGFGLLTGQKAAELMGYSETSSLYQVIRGNEGMSDEKERKMWDAWKERKEELGDKKEKARELYPLAIVDRARPRTGEASRKVAVHHYAATIHIMEGLLSLLADDPLDRLSPAELADLQGTAGDTILRLSAHLSALSSKLILSDQRKGGS